MANDLSKTEYLKRYLEKDEKKSKRKKKRPQPNFLVPRIKIVETNIDLKSIKFGDQEVDEDDEAPIVADIIDDRPVEVKIKEIYESSRWKKLDSTADVSNNFLNDAEIKMVSYDQATEDKSDRLSSVSKKTHNNRSRHDSDSDNSPPRMSDQNNFRNRHDSDSDCSLPRRRFPSPAQTKRHNSDSDNSPPRRREHDKQCDSENSLSHRTKENETKKSKRLDSDSDLSPERIRKRRSSAEQKRNESRIRNSDSDLSPPRATDTSKDYDGSSKEEYKKRPMKTLSGLKAGLQNAATLREETSELRIREKNLINKLDSELSGRNANTIMRDRKSLSFRKRDLEEENRDKEEKEQRVLEQQKKYSEWGKGVEQTEEKKTKLTEDLYEMSKPLARYCDDEDLDAELKSIIHFDDPLAEYMKKKRRQDAVSSMPEYKGPPAPPNRFSIKPGYRWDGVDRSNGFEKKYFEQHSNKKATQEEAYLWSVQNM